MTDDSSPEPHEPWADTWKLAIIAGLACTILALACVGLHTVWGWATGLLA